MMGSTVHSVGIVAVASIVTIALRFLPFVLFPENKEMPKGLTYLSQVLPAAIMGMLLVYCFRNTSFAAPRFGLPEILAAAVVTVMYIRQKKILLPIAVGTVVYMILVQMIFV